MWPLQITSQVICHLLMWLRFYKLCWAIFLWPAWSLRLNNLSSYILIICRFLGITWTGCPCDFICLDFKYRYLPVCCHVITWCEVVHGVCVYTHFLFVIGTTTTSYGLDGLCLSYMLFPVSRLPCLSHSLYLPWCLFSLSLHSH